MRWVYCIAAVETRGESALEPQPGVRVARRGEPREGARGRDAAVVDGG
jgi:hypothetical protein